MKKRQILLYFVTLIILLTTSVFATVGVSLEVNSNKSSVAPGDEFQIVIRLENLDETMKIGYIDGYIDIDENVLEELTVSSIVTDSNGKYKINDDNILNVYDSSNSLSNSENCITFNSNPLSGKGDYKISFNLNKAITTNTDILKINFKVKNNVNPGMYSDVITYKLFDVSSFIEDGENTVQLDNKSVSIIVNGNSSDVNNITYNNNTVSNVVIINTVSNVVVNNTVKNVIVNNTVKNVIVNNTVKNFVVSNKVNNVVANNTVNNVVIDNKLSNDVANKDKIDNKVGNDVVNNTLNNVKTKNNILTKNQNMVDNTTSPSKLPKTGFRIILFPIIIIAIVGLAFYKKYSKYNNYHE